MSKIIKAEKVSLKNNSTITEDMIQSALMRQKSRRITIGISSTSIPTFMNAGGV